MHVSPDTRTRTVPELTIVSVDKHEVVGAGVATWCASADPPIRVAEHFPSATTLLERIPRLIADVDVVVIEPEAPDGRPDLDALRQICAAGHVVVIFTQLRPTEFMSGARQAGASSFVAKSEGRAHLIQAVRAAHERRPHASPAMATIHHRQQAGLTDREVQTLVAWSRTTSKARVAEHLHLEESTVRTHVERARAKYRAVGRPAPTKTALIARLMQDGIINPDDV